MRSRGRRAALLVLLAGCADDQEERLILDASRAVLQEETRIDGHAEDLVPIRELVVGHDGTIAVMQSHDALIRFFSSAGESVGAFGGEGEGPGEFLNPVRMGWTADSLWVYDGRQRRITLIAPDRTLGRTVSNVPAIARPEGDELGEVPEFLFVTPRGLRPNDSFVATMGVGTTQAAPEEFFGRTTVGQVSRDGTLERIITLLPREEGGVVITSQGAAATVPFGNRPHLAVAVDGSNLVVAMASLDGEHSETITVTSINPEGNTIFSRRYTFESEPIPRAYADSVMDARIAALQGAPELAAAVRTQAQVPAAFPPVTNALVGMDDTIWIELREREGERRYYVLEADGEPVGQLALAASNEIAAATLEMIWVLERDPLDVESVVRYSVEWQ